MSDVGEPTEAPGHDAGIEYHARLLDDPHRVAAYERALRRCVTSDSVVLDVGSGTGLLAVLAARCGARRVHAVESMPVGAMIGPLAEANGVGDRIVVHRGDVRELPAAEPVDLIVSEFMGRWVLDDQMMGAMTTAVERWLAPGGRVIPSRITMLAAPVEIAWFEPLDVWRTPLLGVDLSVLAPTAHRHCYGAGLAPPALLADAQPYATLDTRRLDATALHASLAWTIRRHGRLRGIAGWFEAQLTEDVTLSTAPGIQTHWSQYLLPLPGVAAHAGDWLEARIGLAANGNWRWRGRLVREGAAVFDFDQTQQHPGHYDPTAAAVIRGGDNLDDLTAAGARRFDAGDYVAAADAFAAATRLLTPDADPDVAAGIYENLGVMAALAGRHQDAIPALLRALDGDLGSREQSARFLVNACFGAGRHLDGARYLAAYETRFGEHPNRWRTLSGATSTTTETETEE